MKLAMKWRRLARIALLGLVCWGANGCYSYHLSSLPRSDGPSASLGDRVRITSTSGSTWELSNASVVGDSVVGTSDTNGMRVALAVKDVSRVERWSASGWRTAGLVGAIGIVLLGALLLIAIVSVFGSTDY